MAPRLSIKPSQFLVLLVVTTTVFTFVYNYGMTNWENQSQTLIQSLEVVFQSFLTTGYGQDAPWETTRMNLLVIGIQLSGVGLILAAINAFVVPWFRTILHAPPIQDRVDLEDHIVICGYTPRTDAFASVLDSWDISFVFIEADEEEAIAVYELGWSVIHGAPDELDTLSRAGLEDARSVVADTSDAVNASIALSAREIDTTIPVIMIGEQQHLTRYQRLAGANEILCPRQLVGESLANRMLEATTTTVGESIQIADDLELVEVTLSPDDPCYQQQLSACQFERRFDLSVVAGYFDGEYKPVGTTTQPIDETTRILLVGSTTAVADLRSESTEQISEGPTKRVLIVGYGESGKAAENGLQEANTEHTIVDIEDRPGVDIVGDASEPETLHVTGIDDIDAAIITVADDTTAIFTTLIMNDLNPAIDIFVRANDEEKLPQIYRAGATDVHSSATISGRMIAATVMEENSLFTFAGPIQRRTVGDGSFPGKTVNEIELETGIRVLLVLRDDEPFVYEEAREMIVRRGDELVLAGIGNEGSS